jgi:hypothetical protein
MLRQGFLSNARVNNRNLLMARMVGYSTTRQNCKRPVVDTGGDLV